MGASITLAGERLIAQKLGEQQILEVSRFIFANVPGLDPNAPLDRAAGKPPAEQIVHSAQIAPENRGYVNPNQIVYSLQVGSDVGDWDFNWVGLETSEGVLFAVSHVPLQQKRRNIPPLQIGNNITRNFLVVFDGAQALTGITVDASTWQHDFTVRLCDIDERERLSNRDIYGRACFLGTALQLVKSGAAYQLKPGLAYIEGVRVHLPAVQAVTLPQVPTLVALEVALERELNTVNARWRVVFGPGADSVDANGIAHYRIPIAQVVDATTVSDLRDVENIDTALVKHFASRTGDYPRLRARATTKEDVGLSNVPNAISDDANVNDSAILATTKAVYRAFQVAAEAIDKILSGVSSVGKARQLETARRLEITGAGTGGASFDGSADARIDLVLADTGVAAGSYPKVRVSNKGLVLSGEQLQAWDIPDLSWNKITSDKPTTLAGYGISNALRVDIPSKQHPVLAAAAASSFYYDSAMEIREANLVEDTQRGFEHAPSIAFHWAKVAARKLAMDNQGDLYWGSARVYHTENLRPQSIAAPQLNQELTVRTVNNYVEVAARELLLKDAIGAPKLVNGVDVAANLMFSGPGGLDIGTGAGNTWYYVWVVEIAGTKHAILSTSSVAPSGISPGDYRALVGAVRNDAAGNLVQFHQTGRKVSVRPQLVFTGIYPPPNYTAVSLAAIVPPIAKTARGVVGCNAGGAFATERVIAGDANGLGACMVVIPAKVDVPAEGYTSAGYWEVPLVTAQTIFWYGPDGINPEGRMHVCGYEI